MKRAGLAKRIVLLVCLGGWLLLPGCGAKEASEERQPPQQWATTPVEEAPPVASSSTLPDPTPQWSTPSVVQSDPVTTWSTNPSAPVSSAALQPSDAPQAVPVESMPQQLSRSPRMLSAQPPMTAPVDLQAASAANQLQAAPATIDLSQPKTALRSAAPMMAEAEPSVPSQPMAVSPSTTSAPAAAETESRLAETAPATEAPEGYQLVTVFYGTDRKAVDAPQNAGLSDVSWFLLAATSAMITLVLAILMLWQTKSRAILLATGVGLLVTIGLGMMTIKVRMATPANPAGPGRIYGSDRGELEMGMCQVSIPERHEVGEVERPSIFRLELREDPRKHVVLLDVQPEPADRFLEALKARVESSPEKEAFVFVHGYNVTFEAAAQRTAQMAYDLKFPGAPIFYSWPSQGKLLDYTVDETNVAWTVPHLKEFLVNIAQRSGARSVHLIAHSMGNRALTSALQTLSYEMKDTPPLFREVILTAPDIDADVFRRDIAPAIVKTAHRVTLYASSNDEALVMSKKVHGYPRAGDSGSQLVIVPGIDTIDVSSVDTSLLGHSYYGSNGTVLADLLDLLHESKPPLQRRWLRPRQLGEMLYWAFVGQEKNTVSETSPPDAVLR
jgi:esterase/lipase superfamily enzyme